MYRHKIISYIVAIALVAGVLGPLTARADEPAFVTAALSRVVEETEQPKRKGNKLGRVLSAPFRALAKLFGGGGGGRKSQEARKPESRPETESRNAPATQAVPATEEAAAVKSVPSEPVPQPAAPTVPEGARIIRPNETVTTTQPRPGMFIPRIEGVPPDSLSQGRALLQHGYLNEAIAELTIAATVGPGLVEANNLLGLAYDRIGWHRQAIEAYERALTVAPKDPVLLANLGYSLYLADDYHAALKRLKQSARLAPGVSVVHNNIGIVEARLGKYDNAFKSFTLASNSYDAHLKLAGILEMQKRERDAVKHYEAALRLQPGTAAILERLVALYERTGRKQDADTARRALGQPPNPQKTATGGGG